MSSTRAITYTPKWSAANIWWSQTRCTPNTLCLRKWLSAQTQNMLAPNECGFCVTECWMKVNEVLFMSMRDWVKAKENISGWIKFEVFCVHTLISSTYRMFSLGKSCYTISFDYELWAIYRNDKNYGSVCLCRAIKCEKYFVFEKTINCIFFYIVSVDHI